MAAALVTAPCGRVGGSEMDSCLTLTTGELMVNRSSQIVATGQDRKKP